MDRISLILTMFSLLLLSNVSFSASKSDEQAIKRAARDYIESQHISSEKMMRRGLHKKLAKRTYWQDKKGFEFIMETDFNSMIRIAKNYNVNGDKFPVTPLVKISILDIDQRAASVKLTADDWIDYMHLIKNDKNQWKIINVLWQYHDISKQISKR
jgi:hypothetical protein